MDKPVEDLAKKLREVKSFLADSSRSDFCQNPEEFLLYLNTNFDVPSPNPQYYTTTEDIFFGARNTHLALIPLLRTLEQWR